MTVILSRTSSPLKILCS